MSGGKRQKKPAEVLRDIAGNFVGEIEGDVNGVIDEMEQAVDMESELQQKDLLETTRERARLWEEILNNFLEIIDADFRLFVEITEESIMIGTEEEQEP